MTNILKTNNNKLTRNLAETIAGQWQRLKIETVDEAMRVCEKEHKKYKKNTKEQATVITKQKALKEEIIPDWFNKNIEKQTATYEQQQEMQDLLKDFQ